MNYHSEISDIAENLPNGTTRIAIKIGKRRDQLKQIRKLQIPIFDHELIDILEEEGFGIDYPHARLIFFGDSGKPITSRSLTEIIDVEETKPSSTESLTEGILLMAQEMRRFVSVMSDTVREREITVRELVKSNTKLQEEVMVEKLAATSLNMQLDATEEAVEGSYKLHAVKALSNAAEQFAANYATKQLTPEEILKLIMSDDRYIDLALENEELKMKIAQKIAQKSL